MAEPQIVSCPGCGKRYSVPAGAAPGQFQCQDCSSVVVYGRGGAAGGKPSVPARTHARAAAVKRRLARNRRDEEEDDDGDRPGHGRADAKKQNPAFYLMAVVVVALAIGGVAYGVSRTKEKPKPARAPGTAAGPSGVSKFTAEDEPDPSPAPAPKPAPMPAPAPTGDAPRPEEGMKVAVRGGISDKPDPFTPAANPPSGGNYGKSQAAILLLLRDKRSEVWGDPGHLPDTPPDLAQKIDADIAKMADPNGGSDASRAQDRLIKIGRPAIPKVVGLTSRLDFSKYSNILEARDACILGDAIDNVLRSITGYDKVRMLQYSPQNGKITEYLDTLDGWCLWWYTIGYKRETFYKAGGGAEDDKL